MFGGLFEDNILCAIYNYQNITPQNMYYYCCVIIARPTTSNVERHQIHLFWSSNAVIAYISIDTYLYNLKNSTRYILFSIARQFLCFNNCRAFNTQGRRKQSGRSGRTTFQ